jgi:hypothetical protein
METANRRQRLATRREGRLDAAAFLKLADKFIALANRENARVNANDLHMAFLYAAARYNAHVAKVVREEPDHEAFVMEMVEQYRDMLRQHLGDPALAKPPAS